MRFGEFTIKQKLTAIILLTSVSALILASGALIGFERFELRRDMENSLKTQAAILASQSTVSLEFNNQEDAENILSELRILPAITRAEIYNTDGERFAQYKRDDLAEEISPDEISQGEHGFDGEHLLIAQPIIFSDEIIGTLYLKSDLTELNTLLKRQIAVVFIVVIIASFVAFLLSIRFRRIIATPIMDLSRTTKTFTESRDYTLRAIKSSNDEFGDLIDGFNEMLEEIQNRNTALITVKDQVESANESMQTEIADRKNAEAELGHVNKKLTEGDWVKSGIARLDDALRGDKDIPTLSRDIVKSLAEYLDARIGAIFLTDEDQHLEITGRYAYEKSEGVPDRFAFGEGLVGQAAVDDKITLITNVPDDYIMVGSGLGQIPPRNIVVLPFLFDNQVIGVIELGTLDEFSDLQMDLLNQAAKIIAIAVNAARSSQKLKEIYKKTQHQAEELNSQQVKLKAANEELEAFSYSVSHDLRAPLRAIDGFARILLEEHSNHLDQEGLRVLNVISNNVNKMGQLIDNLLAFSRLDRKEIETSHVSMNKLTDELIDEIKADFGERNVNFNIKPLPDSQGDRAMLREVLLNLISNAVKFTGEKDPAIIEILGSTNSDENIYSISDNGVGFNMKYADKLFKVFQRLHSSKQFKGTGIGLALAQRIVGKHGGRIWAEGAVGKGATFYFSLPQKGESDE